MRNCVQTSTLSVKGEGERVEMGKGNPHSNKNRVDEGGLLLVPRDGGNAEREAEDPELVKDDYGAAEMVSWQVSGGERRRRAPGKTHASRTCRRRGRRPC
jgi:hypothetical protein